MSSENTQVALVDDDPAMLRILSVWLKKAGYQVQTFSDAREALAAIEELPPDFLITDWEMPHMNGLELCHRVRELKLSHYIYTIFLTVKSTPTEIIAGLETGADDFLSKPIQRDELLARVRAGARIIELERRLGQLARTDYLTGLKTQRVFYEAIAKEWARVERNHAPLSCVMMDIDFFKKVNDVHGHPAGDAVLRAVAEIFHRNTRANDVPCRYGGEEFCILLPETTEEQAAQWAERIRRQLAATEVQTENALIEITGSFGVASRGDDTDRPETLVDQADQALLCAKQTGRDRVVRFQDIRAGGGARCAVGGPQSLLADIAARQAMSPIVHCLSEQDTIGQAAEFLLRGRINSTCVVDAEGRLAGIVSEKDLLTAMVSLDNWRQPIRDVLKSNVITYDADTPVETIYQFLCRVSIRRVVIVSGSRPIGTISRGTILRLFRDMIAAEDRRDAESPLASRTHMIEASRNLAAIGQELLEEVEQTPGPTTAEVAGRAAQMQGLLNDMLACREEVSASRAITDAD